MKKQIKNNLYYKIISLVIVQLIFLSSVLSNSYSFASCNIQPGDKYYHQHTLSPNLGISDNIIMKTFYKVEKFPPQKMEKFFLPRLSPWLEKKYPKLYRYFQQTPLWTGSMEGYIEEFSQDAMHANSKGGLGAFFGDFLRGMMKIGVKTISFQPLFATQRRQRIMIDSNDIDIAVKKALSSVQSRNYEEYSYAFTRIMVELAELDKLDYKEFYNRIQDIQELKAAFEDDKKNIAFVYTVMLSILISKSIEIRRDMSERSIKKFLREHLSKELEDIDAVVTNTLAVVGILAAHKKFHLKHFKTMASSSLEETKNFLESNSIYLEEHFYAGFKQFITQNKVKLEDFYGFICNYLARLPVQKTQMIEYVKVDYDKEPGDYILDDNNQPFTITVNAIDENNPYGPLKYYNVRFKYLITKDKVLKILLECPELNEVLYKSEQNQRLKLQRFNQCNVTAWATYALLKYFKKHDTYKKLCPGMLHLNESPFVMLAALMEYDESYIRIPRVYTNHTVIEGGLPKFNKENTGVELDRLFYAMVSGYKVADIEPSLTLAPKSLDELKEKFIKDGSIDFSYAALNLSDIPNAVSKEHAGVTKDLFRLAEDIVPVLNGSSDYWKEEKLLELEEEKGQENITGDDLWQIHKQFGSPRFFDEIYKRTGVKLDPDKFTLTLIRRIADYKMQYPILKDIIHVFCADRGRKVQTRWGEMEGLGAQVVLGGFANTFSREEEWIRHFLNWMNDPDLRGRFVFVPDADVIMLKLQAIGADVCLNCPLPLREACGTSGQRGALNGKIPVSIFNSGGEQEYVEQIDLEKKTGSGILVGPYYSNEEFMEKVPKDILDAFTMLTDIFYNDRELWKELMFNAYQTSKKVTEVAMAQRYVKGAFIPAIDKAAQRTQHLISLRDQLDLERFANIDLIVTESILQSI